MLKQTADGSSDSMVLSRQVIPVVGLVSFMIVSSGMSFSIGVLAPYLTGEAGLSVTHVGLLTAIIYGTGSLLSPLAGRLTDQFGAPRSLSAGIACIALGFALFAIAPSIWVMISAVFVSGIALAISNPVTNHVVVEVFDPGRRGVALGVKQAGVPLAAMIAGSTLPAIAADWGWRASFAAAALAVLLIGALCVGILATRTSARGDGTIKAPVFTPHVVDRLSLLNPLGFLMGFGTACVSTYVVLYAVAVLGFSKPRAGLLLTVMGLTGGLARIVWSFLAERSATFPPWFRAMTGVAVVAAILVSVAPYTATWVVWLAMLLMGLSLFVYTSLGMLALLAEVPLGRVGEATGAFSKAFLGGLLLGPIAFGVLTEVTDGYVASWLMVVALLSLAFLLTWAPSFLDVPDETAEERLSGLRQPQRAWKRGAEPDRG